jgi:hypothetical protein
MPDALLIRVGFKFAWSATTVGMVVQKPMPFSSDKLLKQLERPEAVRRALPADDGKEAYAFLMHALGTSQLNVTQNVNGVHLLFKMRSYGNREEVLEKFTELATHPAEEIRSEAFQLAVGLVRFSIMTERNPLILSEAQERNLRGAIGHGLRGRATRLARDFFTD